MEEEEGKKETDSSENTKEEKEKSVENSKVSEGKEKQSSNMKEENSSEKPTDEPAEDSREDKKTSKKDRELYWVFGIMLALIAVFLISFSVFDGSKKFEYDGLTFTKESFGEIPVYHHFYYYSNPGITGSAVADVIKYNLYLRIDPRENDVHASGEIFIDLGKEAYISVNPIDLTQCEYSSVAIANLAAFLVDNQVPVKSASTNETMAEEAQAVYATCDTHPDNAVIIIEAGSTSRVYKENDKCYVISVADCEILEATEKFIVKSIIDANRRKALNPFLS